VGRTASARQPEKSSEELAVVRLARSIGKRIVKSSLFKSANPQTKRLPKLHPAREASAVTTYYSVRLLARFGEISLRLFYAV
jgi:hypothetical protein